MDSEIWVIQLGVPILIGIIIALILNIPLHFFEHKVLSKWIPIKSNTAKRNLGILFSIISIIGIITLALFLVVPELVQAIITLVNIGTDSITIISTLTNEIDYSSLPFGNYLEKVNIDWAALAAWLQDLLPSFFNDLAVRIPDIISSSFGSLINIILGLVFAVYCKFRLI